MFGTSRLKQKIERLGLLKFCWTSRLGLVSDALLNVLVSDLKVSFTSLPQLLNQFLSNDSSMFNVGVTLNINQTKVDIELLHASLCFWMVPTKSRN